MTLLLSDHLQQFERSSAAHTQRIDALLGHIIAQPDCHARFMNTLSLLEHMGSYKILATQRGPAIDQGTLKHVTEEARHAWFFKRQAERLAGRQLDYSASELLAAAPAWMYFQKVEASVERSFTTKPPALAIYLLTSLVIEFRAIWFYARYQRCLDEAGFALSLKKLTGEEQVHLQEMGQRLAPATVADEGRLETLLGAEQVLFERLLTGLERALGSEARAAA